MSGSPRRKPSSGKGSAASGCEEKIDPQLRVGRLNAIHLCRQEAARVYKEMRHGRLADTKGRRLIASLVDIVHMLDAGELAARLQALEEAEALRRGAEGEIGP